jgi:hypothetical protein
MPVSTRIGDFIQWLCHIHLSETFFRFFKGGHKKGHGFENGGLAFIDMIMSKKEL